MQRLGDAPFRKKKFRFEKREHDSSKTQANFMGFELKTEACGVC
jgi:hypothetical protein